MGAEGSKEGGQEDINASALVDHLKEICTKPDKVQDGKAAAPADDKDDRLDKYTKLWQRVDATRKEDREHGGVYDEALVKDGALAWVKFAFRHDDIRWREQGVESARTFFHLKEARTKLANVDFTGSVLLITLPEDDDDEAEPDPEGDSPASVELARLQFLAAQTFCEMADHEEFVDSLCQTSVLNFLCVVLYAVPKAKAIVTDTFVKLSNRELNLIILTEGAVGDILEQFFKTTNFVKPSEEEEDKYNQWLVDTQALGHCAHTLGTLIKYNRPSQVPLERIIAIFRYFLGMDTNKKKEEGDVPDNVRLLAHMARLFYWKCRRVKSLEELLREACASASHTTQLVGDYDYVLTAIVDMWKKCVDTHEAIGGGQQAMLDNQELPKDFDDFCVQDLNNQEHIDAKSDEMKDKIYHANMRLCYMNCSLWVFLPISQLRWKLRELRLEKLYLAFDLRNTEFLEVIIGTARYLVDHPPSHECSQFIKFFGEQFLIVLETFQVEEANPKVVRLLLDAVSIISMQRDMQVMLANYDIWGKLHGLIERQKPKEGSHSDPRELKALKLSVLRTLSECAIHPSHRLNWVATLDDPEFRYPPRPKFEAQLQDEMQDPDENFKTLASMLLTLFNEEKFKKPASEMETTYRAVLEWWQVNTTTRYEDEKAADEEAQENGSSRLAVDPKSTKPLRELLARAQERREEEMVLTSMETMPYCAPHECVLALSLFSRLALEPKFKRMFMDGAIEPLLGCVCLGIWAEAREAAATLANLMWVPDLEEERLVCWLKFDGPKCITVDASNVSVPLKFGNPIGADTGKGMYKSSWGVEFTEGSCVVLHPDGLRTHKVPGTLTSASPSDTYANTSKAPYQWLDTLPEQRHFTITCWFYWPLPQNPQRKNVLLHAAPQGGMAQISLEYDEGDVDSSAGVWHVTDEKGKKIRMKTPRLNAGWHMLSLVSTTKENKAVPFDGTKFYIDDWHCEMKGVWVKNQFHTVGNTAQHGAKRPFGLITDFRIYARSLRTDTIKAMVAAKDMEDHPDKIVQRLASMNAAEILAQRLDVPDSACECLRALGSLATLSSQRAKIFSVCGQQIFRMVDSPLPMIQRQSARLLNNIS